MGETWRRFARRDPLLARCLPWWLALLVPTVLVEQADGAAWGTVAAILSPLTGALGAVVIGAFSVDRWRQQQALRERRDDVSRMSRALLVEHDALRSDMARAASAAYQVATPLLSDADRIPEELLVTALTRPPYTKPTLDHGGEPVEVSLGRTMQAIADNVEASMYQRIAGPLPWAIAQLQAMWLTSSNLRTDDDPDTWWTPPTDVVGATDAVVQQLLDNGPQLLEACETLQDRLRDLHAIDIYRPVAEELTGEDDHSIDTVELLGHARGAVDHARALRRIGRLDGEPRNLAEVLADLLRRLHLLLRAISRTSSLLQKQTIALASYQDPSEPLAGIHKLRDLLEQGAADAGRQLDYLRWEEFKRTAAPPPGIPTQVSPDEAALDEPADPD